MSVRGTGMSPQLEVTGTVIIMIIMMTRMRLPGPPPQDRRIQARRAAPGRGPCCGRLQIQTSESPPQQGHQPISDLRDDCGYDLGYTGKPRRRVRVTPLLWSTLAIGNQRKFIVGNNGDCNQPACCYTDHLDHHRRILCSTRIVRVHSIFDFAVPCAKTNCEQCIRSAASSFTFSKRNGCNEHAFK